MDRIDLVQIFRIGPRKHNRSVEPTFQPDDQERGLRVRRRLSSEESSNWLRGTCRNPGNGNGREPCFESISRYTVAPRLDENRDPAQVAELADALG